MNRTEILIKILRVAGLILFCFGGYLAYSHHQTMRKTIETEGVVVTIDERTNQPLIRFKTISGYNVTALYEEEINIPYQINDHFMLRYDSENPSEIYLVSSFMDWQGVIIAMIGLALFLTGIIFTFRTRKKGKIIKQ